MLCIHWKKKCYKRIINDTRKVPMRPASRPLHYWHWEPDYSLSWGPSRVLQDVHSIPDLYPLDISSTLPAGVMTPKNVSNIAKCSLGDKTVFLFLKVIVGYCFSHSLLCDLSLPGTVLRAWQTGSLLPRLTDCEGLLFSSFVVGNT